ncbi:MAG: hypothetical protein Kow0047_21540 [Anaerolineae bacterium]
MKAQTGFRNDIGGPRRSITRDAKAIPALSLPGALVALAAIAYIIFFSALSIARHEALLTNAYDLGNVDQAVWNTAHGKPLAFTNWEGRARTFKAGTRLAMHVEPIYFLIAPLYWIWSDPRALLILQSTVLGLGALPAYWLARHRLQDGFAAVAFPLVYLLFPALQAANLFDFHAVTLSGSLLLFAIYALITRRDRMFLLFALLVASTKEEMPLAVAMMGLYAAVVQRRWRLGLPVAVLGIAWSLVAVFWIVPMYNTSGRSPYMNYFDSAGIGVGDGAPGASMLRQLLTRQNGVYLWRLFFPVAFLSLLSPTTLAILGPSLFIILISDNPQMHHLERFHYAAPLVPVVVAAAIMGTSNIAKIAERRLGWRQRAAVRWLSVLVLLFTGVYHYHRGFTVLADGFEWPQRTEHARRLEEIARLIPPEASLSTQHNLNPHFSQRPRINLFPYSLETEYLLLDAATFTANKDNFLAWVRDSIVNGSEFGLVTAEDGYILLRRGAPKQPLPEAFYTFLKPRTIQPEYPITAEFGDAIRLHGYDIFGRRGDERRYVLYLEAMRPLDTDYQIALYLLNEQGETIGATEEPPSALVWYPTSRWRPGEIIRVEFEPVTWYTRETPEFGVAVGIYEGSEVWDIARRLRPRVLTSRWQVFLPAEQTTLRLAVLRNRWFSRAEDVPLRRFTPPRIPRTLQATLGGEIKLLGYDVKPTTLRPGERLCVRLYWQARAPVAESLTVFVHLLDGENQVRGQRDGPPGRGLRPTDTWMPGEVIVDDVCFDVATETPPGPHQVEVGMYRLETGIRLPVVDGTGTPIGDHVMLPQVITIR